MWRIFFTKKVVKSVEKLPLLARDHFDSFVLDLEYDGPIQKEWSNFSKLGKTTFHCHIKKGRPTYVCCWRLISKKEKLIEVYYVGTHEKAPY